MSPQLLAIVMVAAFVINTQCTASCSLQSLAATSHSCCHHKRAPAHMTPESACAHAVTAAGEVRLENSVSASLLSLPMITLAETVHDFRAAVRHAHTDLRAASCSPVLNVISSTGLLRI